MKRGESNKPVAPIYTVAIIWLICTLIHPVTSFGRLIFVAALSVLGGSVARVVSGRRKNRDAADAAAQTQQQQTQAAHVRAPQSAAAASVAAAKAAAEKAAAEKEAAAREAAEKAKTKAKPKYSPEVQAILDEGKKARAELSRLYATIPDLSVKRKISEIIDVSDKIVKDAVDDPSDVPQIKKFLDYYLPTTIKLLNVYDRMGAQGVRGQNITATMQNINDMLDNAIDAYKKLLDSLFANQALDIETDISVMNTLLQREGFMSQGGASAFPPANKKS